MTCRPQFALLMAAVLALGGCVTLPLPPVKTGETEPGAWGVLMVRVVAEYKPNFQGLMRSFVNRASDGKETKEPAK